MYAPTDTLSHLYVVTLTDLAKRGLFQEICKIERLKCIKGTSNTTQPRIIEEHIEWIDMSAYKKRAAVGECSAFANDLCKKIVCDVDFTIYFIVRLTWRNP